MLSPKLEKHLMGALRRFAHLEALALLFHVIAESEHDGLFGQARADLNRNFPDNARKEAEISRLAGLFSTAYQTGTPCPDADIPRNPLLIAAALEKQLGELFLSPTCVPVEILGRHYQAFLTRSRHLHNGRISPRHWFQPIWFVGSPFDTKEVEISHVDWRDGTAPVCAMIEFDDNIGLDKEMAGDTFIVRGLADEEVRWNSLNFALQAARKAKAQIIVLPELSMTQSLLDRLSDWLNKEKGHPFRLIAAGSYHYRDSSDVLARNRMIVLDRNGVPLLHHDKWFEFDHSGRERINPGSALQLLTAPPGLLSFAICKDFGHADGFNWKGLVLDGLCVASMGGESNQAAARKMRLSGTRVLLANNTEESDGAYRGFFTLPGGNPQVNSGNVTLRAWNGVTLEVVK